MLTCRYKQLDRQSCTLFANTELPLSLHTNNYTTTTGLNPSTQQLTTLISPQILTDPQWKQHQWTWAKTHPESNEQQWRTWQCLDQWSRGNLATSLSLQSLPLALCSGTLHRTGSWVQNRSRPISATLEDQCDCQCKTASPLSLSTPSMAYPSNFEWTFALAQDQRQG